MSRNACRGTTLGMAVQSIQPIVLLTRPEAPSARFGKSLTAVIKDVQVIISPLLMPVFLATVLPQKPWHAVILTSETGAIAAGRLKAELPDLAFCVGDTTAQAARAAGFTPRSAQGDADALLSLILSDPRPPLLHLRGRDVRGDITKRLLASGVEADDVAVYAQIKQPMTPEAAARLQGQAPILVALFSPRSAEIFGAECRRIGATAPITVVAISPAVADVALHFGFPVNVAGHPDGQTMLETVVNLLQVGQRA